MKMENIENIYNTFRTQILRGEFLEGDKLPSEWQICRSYNVQRTIVRKALEQLREEGLIISRQGAGSFVIARPEIPTDAPHLITGLDDLEHCYEYRILLEPGVAALAAERRTEVDVEEMKKIAKEQQKSIQQGGFGIKSDFKLHVKIAKASRNKFLLSSVLSLRTDVVFSMMFSHQVSIHSPQERYSFVDHEHSAIIEAIAKKDVEAARETMYNHINKAWIRLKKGKA